jgi:hypothetical protein
VVEGEGGREGGRQVPLEPLRRATTAHGGSLEGTASRGQAGGGGWCGRLAPQQEGEVPSSCVSFVRRGAAAGCLQQGVLEGAGGWRASWEQGRKEWWSTTGGRPAAAALLAVVLTS